MTYTTKSTEQGSILLACIIISSVISASTLTLIDIIHIHQTETQKQIKFQNMQLTTESIAHALTQHLNTVPTWNLSAPPTLLLNNPEHYKIIKSPSQAQFYITKTATHLHIWGHKDTTKTTLKRPL